MKNNINNARRASLLMLLMVALFSGVLFQSCDDDDDSGAIPSIKYVRMTDPLLSDSLITHAFMGTTIVFIGDNLQDVKEVWFNDKKAKLTTSFITANSLVLTIPKEIPEAVTNQVRLITQSGVEGVYDFVVDVPGPILDAMLCEFVADGDIAELQGNYFIDNDEKPLEVYFPGNVKAEVVDVTLNKVRVKVPAGVSSGPVSMKTIYGSSRSTFMFRDDRNVIINYDNLTTSGSWRGGTTMESEQSLDGKYLVMKASFGDNAGSEDGNVSELWSDANGRPEGSLLPGDPENYVLKFEANVIEWSGAYLNVCWGPWASSVGGFQNQLYWADINARGLWKPWEGTSSGSFKTDGWITVTIPLSDMKYNKDFGAMKFDKALAGSLTFWMKGPAAEKGGTCKMEVYIDNVRIVNK